MKQRPRLAPLGWPFLVIFATLLLVALAALSPTKKIPRPIPAGHVPTVRYGMDATKSGDDPEIRALYASDLFASSRCRPFTQARATMAEIYRTNMPPDSMKPPSLPPAAPVKIRGEQSSANGKTPFEQADSLLLPQPSQRLYGCVKKYQKLSIELSGGLRNHCSGQELLGDLPLQQEGKNWTFKAEMRFNSHGEVDRLLVESSDCAPSLYQDISMRLFRCRLNDITQECSGIVIISYPATTTNPPMEQSGTSGRK